MMLKNKLNFKIVTPENITYQDEVLELIVPTKDGQIAIMANHEPLVSVLKPGTLVIKKDNHQVSLVVSAGCLEVRPGGEVIIMSHTAERVEDIDLERARLRANKIMAEKHNLNEVEFAHLQAILERDLARIKARS